MLVSLVERVTWPGDENKSHVSGIEYKLPLPAFLVMEVSFEDVKCINQPLHCICVGNVFVEKRLSAL